MERERIIGVLLEVITQALEARGESAHRLTAQLIREKLNELLHAYVFSQRAPSPSVAQYNALKDCVRAADSLADILRIASATLNQRATPLLESLRTLLEFRLLLGDTILGCSDALDRERRKDPPRVDTPIPTRLSTSPKKVSAKDVLTDTKKRILDFIRQRPEVRTKDLIEEFSSISGRTIKRNLKELVMSGELTKRAEHKAVFYSAP